MSRRLLFHPDDATAVLPGALSALTDIRNRGLAHRYVRHVRSSQAFALSLFAPLDADGVRTVLAHLGHDVQEVEVPFFEYEDTLDRLAEASKRSPHRTQVDVLLRGTTEDGRRVAALIEVKLGEPNFGTCSAFASPENVHRDVCGQPGLFGGDPGRCFQLNNHGYGHRRYAEYLVDVELVPPSPRADDGGCWVRTGRSQPMRNLALAQMLVAEGEADEIVFALCAPDQHDAIWRRFAEFRAVFCDTEDVTIRELRAETVARQHPDGGTAFTLRYLPALSDRALLHLSTDGSTLLGVWVHRDGRPTSYYDVDTHAAEEYAEAIVLRRGWDWLLERLPQSSPYVAWWEKTPCGPDEPVEDVFHRIKDVLSEQ
jgi:hypothetical protein